MTPVTRRRLLRTVALGAFALSGSAAWVLLDQPPAPEPEPPPTFDQVRPLPSLHLPGFDGAPDLTNQSIAQAGGPVLLNVFASWCAPCVAELPVLMKLRQRGVPIWGIAYQDKPADIRTFLDRFANPYARIALDERGSAGAAIGLTGVPETLIVDAAGVVRWRFPGNLTDEAVAGSLLPKWRGLG